MDQIRPAPRGATWVLSLVVLGGLGCGAKGTEGGAPPRYGRVVLPLGRTLQVELAETPARRRRGYMFRPAVGPEDGMLFLFREEDFYPFWMKNVRMPLDILWISEGGRVVDLSPETPPCRSDPCRQYVPLARARYVLELAGGRAAQLGLSRGDLVEILLPAPAREP